MTSGSSCSGAMGTGATTGRRNLASEGRLPSREKQSTKALQPDDSQSPNVLKNKASRSADRVSPKRHQSFQALVAYFHCFPSGHVVPGKQGGSSRSDFATSAQCSVSRDSRPFPEASAIQQRMCFPGNAIVYRLFVWHPFCAAWGEASNCQWHFCRVPFRYLGRRPIRNAAEFGLRPGRRSGGNVEILGDQHAHPVARRDREGGPPRQLAFHNLPAGATDAVGCAVAEGTGNVALVA